MSFGNQVQNVNLTKLGLCMLNGINQSTPGSSSNGAGKSSLIEAIIYGLYGKRADGVKGDELVNQKTGHNLLVEVSFVTNGTDYLVKRFRKDHHHQNHTFLYQNGVNVTAKSIRATNQKLRWILGMDQTTFLHSYMVGVGDTVNFTSATDHEKKEILENLAHLSLYSKAYEMAKDDLSRLKNQISEINAKLQSQQYAVDSLKQLRDNAVQQRNQQRRQLESINNTLKRVTAKIKQFPIKSYRNQLNHFKRLINAQHLKEQRYQAKVQKAQKKDLQASNQLKDWRERIKQLQASASDLKQTRHRLATELDSELGLQQDQQQKIRSLKSRIDRLNSKIKSIPVEKYQDQLANQKRLIKRQHTRERQHQSKLQVAQRNYVTANDQVKSLNQELVKQRKQLDEFKQNYDQLISGKARRCFYCGQVLDQAHRKFETKRLAKQLSQLELQFRKLDQDRNQSGQKARHFHQIDQKLQDSDPNRVDYYSKAEQLHALLNHYQKLVAQREERQNQLSAQQKLVRERTNDQQRQRAAADRLSNQLANVRHDLQKFKKSRTRINLNFNRARAEYQKIQKKNPDQSNYYPQVNHLNGLLNNYRILLDRQRDYRKRRSEFQLTRTVNYSVKLKSAQKQLTALKNQLARLKQNSKIMKNVKEVYSNRGVRSQVLDLILPFINQQANHYLQTLAGGSIRIAILPVSTAKNGNQSDRITVRIQNASGGSRYADNSSGEKRRVDVAIAMAMQDYTCYHARSRCNLMCVDEAFDNLDSVGTNRIMQILAQRQRVIPNILVVSHNPDLQANFSNQLTVIKTDRGSIIDNKNH